MTSATFVCPFCPLHCDDLDPASLLAGAKQPVRASRKQSVEVTAKQPAAALGVTCSLLARRLAAAIDHDATAMAAKAAVLERARRWVAAAARIRITGAVIDLATARALCRLAQRSGASIDLDGDSAVSVAAAAYRELFARSGGFAITLGDAASAHVAIIQIGDTSHCWPRLGERLSAAGQFFSWQSVDDAAERLAQLRRLLRRPDEASPPDDPDVARSRELCGRAQSLVFIVAADLLGAAEARPFWSTMAGLLRDLNPQRRAALLRFDDALTLRSVATWNSDGEDEQFTVGRLADAELVIELVGPGSAPSPSDRPAHVGQRITIGGPVDSGVPSNSGDALLCHLPASSPGIGCCGVVFRGDGSVALPLRPLVANGLPSPAEVLRQLLPS